jgi:hypothetical protein
LLFVLLYFFLLAIVLSIVFRYTDSDYHFGIFKLFLISYMFYFDNSPLISVYNLKIITSDIDHQYGKRCTTYQ